MSVQSRSKGRQPAPHGHTPPWLLALALLGTGCQELPRERAREVGDGADRNLRELQMNERWQWRPMSELVATLGEPVLVMNIPGGGNPPGFAVVFHQDRASGCIDAFAMMPARDPVVRNYYCR